MTFRPSAEPDPLPSSGERSGYERGRPDEPTVIRGGEPADLLALLSIRLGFRPEESLVVGCLDGPRSRLGFVLRVDLPAPGYGEALVASVLPTLLRHGHDEAVLAVVSDQAHAHASTARCLVEALTRSGIDVREALLADGHRWWSLLCTDPACCSTAGTPYELASSPVMAQAVLAGVCVLPSRTLLSARLAPQPGARSDAVAVAVEQTQASLTRRWRAAGEDRPARRAILRHGAARVRHLVETSLRDASSSGPDDQVLGELALWATLVPVRDVAWSLMSRGSADAHARLWTQVARHAPPGTQAAPLALAGFASWLLGDGAAAWCAVERCRQISPGYSMAELLAGALERAIPPNAWTPPSPERLDAALDAPAPGAG